MTHIAPLQYADRVLVCDADPRSIRALRLVLRDGGFAVHAASSAEEALDSAALRLPTIAIVELELPDGDGVESCRRLHEWSDIPLIVVSAIADEHQKVRALDAGADDYVTKPFAPSELVARVRAALRRTGRDTLEPCIEAAGMTIDFARHTVRRDGEEIHLTPIEYRLLSVLARTRGRLITHESLLRQVWGPGYLHDTPTLRTHIANLRRKLATPLIHTTPGVGYRFEEPPARIGSLSDAHPPRRATDLRAA
jgi:two-component system, OmpR family, KDP operon response regulator KdpE